MIEIRLNGDPHEVPDGLNIHTLLLHLGIDPSRVAVEFNRRIVKKREWNTTTIESGSQIEVVEFVGGG